MPFDSDAHLPCDIPTGAADATGGAFVGSPGTARDSAEDGRGPSPRLGSTTPTIPWPEEPLGEPRGDSHGFELAETVADWTSFGKYELLGELGRGGMGVVFKARQVDLDRLVAIKMILASHLASGEQIERFYAEARATARLRSPHIVAIHEVGEIHGQHYFAMEYIAGPSLARLIESGPVDPERAARLVLTVARAVSHLHNQGIVHRDLKPSNVLLDERGEPRVSDFGLAKMLAADAGTTGSGVIVGTPSYMAPEQAAGRAEEVGPLTDLYAVGAILYELLTGRPPFRADNPLDTLVQVLEGEPRPPRRLRPGLPASLEAICLKCLNKTPAERYASAEALAEDLERFLKHEQVEARRATAWQRLRRWARREPALACRLGLMVSCGLIVLADFLLLSRSRYDLLILEESIGVVILWAFCSLLCRAALRSERWGDLPRFVWAAADVGLFTALVWLNSGLSTALVAGYFLLVTASGLWFRDHLVWFTTGLAVVAYGALALIQAAGTREAPASPYGHFIFATALAVTGLVIAYQVKRVRALSHYYEHRPLP
jgi:serine/threonine-protein kinase